MVCGVTLVIGKDTSHLLRELCQRRQSASSKLVMTTNNECLFQQVTPDARVHTKFDTELVFDYIQQQLAALQRLKHMGCSGRHDPKLDSLFVLDNPGYDGHQWVRDKGVQFLFMNGRCIRTDVLVSVAYPVNLTSALLGHVDYAFIFHETDMCKRRGLYDLYAGMFTTFEMFCQVMDQCSGGRKCLVIDNTSTSAHRADQVFWYETNGAG